MIKMLKMMSRLLFIFLFFSRCTTESVIPLNSKDYFYKYYRNFSFYTQDFNEEIRQETLAKFCYKVYFHRATGKRAAFEFINERNITEFMGYFNVSEKLQTIEVQDSSRGRMNMSFFYNPDNLLTQVRLLDDNKKIFAYGKAQYSANKKLLFVVFKQAETHQKIMYIIIRTNDQGNDEEIATYSAEGMLFSNHLYFYDDNGRLNKYEFYRKLKFIVGFQFFANGFIKEITPENRRLQGSFAIE